MGNRIYDTIMTIHLIEIYTNVRRLIFNV